MGKTNYNGDNQKGIPAMILNIQSKSGLLQQS